MTALAPKIAALIRLLLGTDKEGEIVGAAHALRRVLATADLDHHRLADVVEHGLTTPNAQHKQTHAREHERERKPTPDPDDWRALVEWCASYADMLDMRDADFIESIAGRSTTP